MLTTNISSLSVTASPETAGCPSGSPFSIFNPVPLMQVEVIDGLTTDRQVGDRLQALAARMGHRGIRAKDTPGYPLATDITRLKHLPSQCCSAINEAFASQVQGY
ncbi:3-hydroxyacyl-CoA dehydrogenase NAD-binding domain-containing protein [Pseudomonas grimontii]|uniref:3-hydroxyacyl-CoA dehydrogenase NAD-binding domain-containing protein n=1 Tax=Pseudomonas grimontii TaxID=129847 RepID=UPI00387B1151